MPTTYEKIDDDTIKKITIKEETYLISEINNNIQDNENEIEKLENSKLTIENREEVLLPAIKLFNKNVDKKIITLEGWIIEEEKLLRNLEENI